MGLKQCAECGKPHGREDVQFDFICTEFKNGPTDLWWENRNGGRLGEQGRRVRERDLGGLSGVKATLNSRGCHACRRGQGKTHWRLPPALKNTRV